MRSSLIKGGGGGGIVRVARPPPEALALAAARAGAGAEALPLRRTSSKAFAISTALSFAAGGLLFPSLPWACGVVADSPNNMESIVMLREAAEGLGVDTLETCTHRHETSRSCSARDGCRLTAAPETMQPPAGRPWCSPTIPWSQPAWRTSIITAVWLPYDSVISQFLS